MKGQEVNFAAVKQGVEMEAVLRHYQVDDLQGGRGGRYRGRCPIHRGEGRDAFHVDVKRKIFHCFSCGAGGDVLDLVALLNQCTLREAALQLKDWFPGAATGGEPPGRQRVRKGNISVNLALKFRLGGVDGAHAYWRARAIKPSTASEWGVGYYRGAGMLSGRVVIPIHDEQGQLVAYAGRSVDGREPRYRFPAGFGKSQVLFNFHRAAASAGDRGDRGGRGFLIVCASARRDGRAWWRCWERSSTSIRRSCCGHGLAGCCCCWMETRRGVWVGTESRPD